MEENKATTVKAPSSRELALALALGWAAAELVGRYRHGNIIREIRVMQKRLMD